MDLRTLAERVDEYCVRNAPRGASVVRPIEGLALLRHTRTTALDATLYEPVACLILQGAKETITGARAVELRAGHSLVVSHETPIQSRITDASPTAPYLAVVLAIDISVVRGLYDEVGPLDHAAASDGSFAVHAAEPKLVDAIARYLALADDPMEARVLGPPLRRELHFRLLTAPHGGMLRQMLRHDSHASSVARAIAHIRGNFRGAISVPELARVAGMSPSSLHKHFKSVTATTPLQFQKELRLLEARRQLVAGADSVSGVAYDVGYASPNQFSREYARKYGAPPRDHLGAAE